MAHRDNHDPARRRINSPILSLPAAHLARGRSMPPAFKHLEVTVIRFFSVK
jgi:hypothetical protein